MNRNPGGNPASLRHDREQKVAAAIAGAGQSSARLTQRWREKSAEMLNVVRRASAAVPQGTEHPNGKIYMIYRPDGQPPIRGVKNLSLWVRENLDLLRYTCKAASASAAMTSTRGWRGWRARPAAGAEAK